MSFPTLFITWRSPQTRAVLPVGRMVFLPERSLYEFVYIKAVKKAQEQGFLPFLEFPDLQKVYRSAQPFPILSNRVMQPRRPEHAGFLASLGLSTAAHPLEILARSGGQRVTDQIAMFPMPEPDAAGCYLTYCLVQAIRYMPQPATEERIARLQTGEQLFIMADVQNPVDPSAIALRTADNHMIGYLPGYFTSDAWKLADGCGTLTVNVERVNYPPAEPHHRLLVRVGACWPEGFRPFADDAFQPVARM